jgi:hypothetical protein
MQKPLGNYYLRGFLKAGGMIPVHRSFILDFKRRVRELMEHHRVRANEAMGVLEKNSQTAYQAASQMSWDIVAKSWDDFPIMQKWFATGEAVAHLIYLERLGLVQREIRDGLIYFSSKGKRKL